MEGALGSLGGGVVGGVFRTEVSKHARNCNDSTTAEFFHAREELLDCPEIREDVRVEGPMGGLARDRGYMHGNSFTFRFPLGPGLR